MLDAVEAGDRTTGVPDRAGIATAPHTVESVRRELRGQVFQLGPGGEWQARERYCSGDVVGKLAEARRWSSVDAGFTENVEALTAVQPERVSMSDPSAVTDGAAEGITVPLGAPWVPGQVYLDFLRHLFPAFDGWGASCQYVEETATWLLDVSNKYLLGSVENTRTYGTGRMTAVDLLSCGLRLQLPVVYDEDADGSRVKNAQETALAQAKLQEIRERWAAWLPRDQARRTALEDEYNHRYNRFAPRPYDGSHLSFPALALTYQGAPLVPRPHQVSGALRIVERGERDDTTLLAYFPGAGKTLAAYLGVVKRLQLGLSNKAVIVVPKNVLGQWQRLFREVYPTISDWILAGTDEAFDARNRRRFLATAALSPVKIVLLTYEQWRTVPLRPETFRAYLKREVSDLERAILGVEDQDPSKRNLERAFKQRQRSLANFEAKYESRWTKVQAAGDADVSWERWGCDLLVCDEGHLMKSDLVTSKMDGVSGLPRGESQRAFDGRVKIHYVTTPDLFPNLFPADHRGGKYVELSGTPVTNSLVETWIAMRRLQPRLLREMGMWQFDAWAATFTTQVPSPEMDAVGEWRVRTRLKFHNLPELQAALGLCWDRVDPKLAQDHRPDIVGDRMRVVETEGSDDLREYTRELAERAERVRRRLVEPEEDNMLKITHDGRCASVFNGVPSRTWPAGRKTKLDAVVREVLHLYEESDDVSGVQLVFVDLYTPKEASDAGDLSRDGGRTRRAGPSTKSEKLRALAASTHSQAEARSATAVASEMEGAQVSLIAEEIFLQQGVYGVIRDQLVAAGMLAREVAYVHDAATDDERAELFRRANAGEIRVLIGSTQKMGLGVNVQRRAYAAHHVTVPWRPDWLDQANKRVDRDGNLCEAVHIVCYPTVGSYDVVLWQFIEQKSEFVSAINSGTYAGRSADDIGDLQVDATTAKAVALGDLRVVEKVKLEVELSALQRQHRVWKAENSRSQWELADLPARIAEQRREVEEWGALRAHRDAHQLRSFEALLQHGMAQQVSSASGTAPSASAADPARQWVRVADRSAADQRVHVLADSLRHRLGGDGLLVGQYRGLDLLLTRDQHGTHLCARHRLPGGAEGAEVVAKNVGTRGGVGAFAQLEAQLASVETLAHRLTVQLDIREKRLSSLRAEAPAWSHATRAAALLARYDEICAAVATAGIVDRQGFNFS